MIQGFQVGYIYEMNGRYMVCISMDWQTQAVTFKIYSDLEKAKAHGAV